MRTPQTKSLVGPIGNQSGEQGISSAKNANHVSQLRSFLNSTGFVEKMQVILNCVVRSCVLFVAFVWFQVNFHAACDAGSVIKAAFGHADEVVIYSSPAVAR